MDAWAALWFWPVTTSVTPPTREEWLIVLEALLGKVSKAESRGGRGLFADDTTWAELDEAEQNEVAFTQMRQVEQLLDEHRWLGVCAEIAAREGFFHWELDFAPLFTCGGFDLQLGNPPWVRPEWKEPFVLAEDDAWFGLVDKPHVGEFLDRRELMLDDGDTRYLNERAAVAGVSAYLGNAIQWPRLNKVQTNLYRCFIDRAWRSASNTGLVSRNGMSFTAIKALTWGDGALTCKAVIITRQLVGLLHPDSHLSEQGADEFRKEVYRRTRRQWNFTNQLKLFEEIGNTRTFSIVVYGNPRPGGFLMAASLYHPDTIDRSLMHDGSGPEPGIKDDNDEWDLRPHSSRIIVVDDATLWSWARISGESGADNISGARPFALPNQSSQNVLTCLASAPRFGAIEFDCDPGWVEASAQRRGYLTVKSSRVTEWSDVVLQGPHISGSPGTDVDHPGDFSWGRSSSMGPQESMTRASAALAEWKP